MANILKTALNAAGIATPTDAAKIETTTHVVKYRNVVDLIGTLSRRSQLAALRSLAGAVQFTMINTADWMVRLEDKAIASQFPTLDERNAADEFTRGQSIEDELTRENGHEVRQTPEEKLKQYSHLYYGLVDAIRQLRPEKAYERPMGIKQVLAEFTPRGQALPPDVIALLESVESEPGEFLAARNQAQDHRATQMNDRKPRVLQILETNADCNPIVDVMLELPVHTQLRLATAAWKGVYFSRKSLVTFIATYNDTSDIGDVKVMQADLKKLEDWTREFETEHVEIFEALVESDVRVYGMDDAIADAKRPRVK